MGDHEMENADVVQNVTPELPDLGAQKAWVGLIVATVFSSLTTWSALVADGSQERTILTIVLAALTPLATALGVYSVTNRAR
jgi:hypothetical protein